MYIYGKDANSIPFVVNDAPHVPRLNAASGLGAFIGKQPVPTYQQKYGFM